MKTTVSFHDFRDSFEHIRPNNFSYEGLSALFDYLEQYEQETNTELELDVIAFCCEFSEATISEALDYYDYETLDELIDNTTVIFVDELTNWKGFDRSVDGDKRIIYQTF